MWDSTRGFLQIPEYDVRNDVSAIQHELKVIKNWRHLYIFFYILKKILKIICDEY